MKSFEIGQRGFLPYRVDPALKMQRRAFRRRLLFFEKTSGLFLSHCRVAETFEFVRECTAREDTSFLMKCEIHRHHGIVPSFGHKRCVFSRSYINRHFCHAFNLSTHTPETLIHTS